MRVGVMGGTFDPPHNGHLAFAHAAISELKLDEVIFVPANRNPLKDRGSIASAKHRLAMVQAMIDPETNLSACDLEIQKGGMSYAVETMTELSIAYPGEYWFLVGFDALKDFSNWKQPQRLLRLCRLGVALRPPATKENLLVRISKEIIERIDLVPMPAMDVSSSSIRNNLIGGRPASKDLPKTVNNYIHSHNLYNP